MNNYFVILAAGKSKRFHKKIPKQFYYYRNKEIIEHSIEKSSNSRLFKKIVVVTNNLNHLNIRKNVNIEFSHNLYNDDKTIYYKKDAHGFRGDYLKTSGINILTLGGSTTEQVYISEGKTWQDILQNLFV